MKARGFSSFVLKIPFFQVHVGSMRATSRGYVKLRTANPYDHPLIDPNYLATEEDRVELRESVRLTREIFGQKAFDPFRGKELQPGLWGQLFIIFV